MKLLSFLFVIIVLTGCYTPVKVQNLTNHATEVVEVDEDFASLLSSGDTVVFNEYNSNLRPSESFVGVVIEESMAVTIGDTINPITGDSIISGTILPCVAKAGTKTGDIIYVSPLTGDVYYQSIVGIKCVFVK